jgi:hypothetical protein
MCVGGVFIVGWVLKGVERATAANWLQAQDALQQIKTDLRPWIDQFSWEIVPCKVVDHNCVPPLFTYDVSMRDLWPEVCLLDPGTTGSNPLHDY